ncbi:hypothetical protein GCM10007908_00190 [Rhizobium albus]|nr:hypothetical protein GCM10007908_00190 [Rhizobium albus]
MTSTIEILKRGGGAGRRSRPLVAALGLAIAAAVPSAAQAADGSNPDWPCIQRLVPRISTAQVWAGPEPEPAAWARNEDVRAMAEQLSVRRLPIEEARTLVADYAQALPESERNDQLTALFGRTLELINRDRASIIAGIGRYARSQRERAEHIRSSRIAAAENAPATASADSAPTALDWEIRVFDERRRALIYLCEQPVLLDQRAFALGQAIYSHMVKE